MAQTGKLGTPDSYLGNVILGIESNSAPVTYDESIYIDGTSEISQDSGVVGSNTHTVGGLASLSALGGFVHSVSQAVEGLSQIALLPGWGYSETFDLSVLAGLDYVDELLKDAVLGLTAEADLSFDIQSDLVAAIIVAGTASESHTGTFTTNLSLDIPATSTIFIENLFEFLYATTVSAGLTIDLETTGGESQNPSSEGGFSVETEMIYGRTSAEALVFVESWSAVRLKLTAFETLSFVCEYDSVLTKNRELSEELTFVSSFGAYRLISDAIVFDDSYEYVRAKVASVSETLSFTETYSRQILVNRTLSDVLDFSEEKEVEIPFDGMIITVPSWEATLVPTKCVVILSSNTRTITLPCPVFGDSQSYQGTLNLKRTMTGGTYTYIRRSRTQKLSYTFELWTHKYLELKAFVAENNAKFFTLFNHNAERWIVAFANNPIEFSNDERYQPKGEKYTVTLEFEGVKL